MTKGRYLVRSIQGRLYLTALDAALDLIAGKPSPPRAKAVERLLIGIGGHLGDAVIASSVLPWIREALPGVRLGLALPSGSRLVLEGHPDIAWWHTVDHWKVNRRRIPAVVKGG